MSKQVDSASTLINVSPSTIYWAFAEPDAMQACLPPQA